MYLLRIESEAELQAFADALFRYGLPRHQRLATKLLSYLHPYPPGQCQDCGVTFEDKEQLVSPDSAELHEVMLEGMQAIEAKPRIVCRPCWQAAAERKVAEQAQGL